MQAPSAMHRQVAQHTSMVPVAAYSRGCRVAAPAAIGKMTSVRAPRRAVVQSRRGCTCAAEATRRRSLSTSASATEEGVIDIEANEIDERVPVTIITGFLGSGKTTLLNHILTQPHGKRIAVIENEFGAVDIDSDLVAVEQQLPGTAEKVVMLNNGCLCCTVRDDLVELLNQLYEERDKYDHIVIETTGLANPGPVVQTFLLNESTRDRMRLDGVVTLVDAKHVERHLEEEDRDAGQKGASGVNETIEQIALADRIILNKTDLVNESDLDRIEARVRRINSLAEVVRSSRSSVSVEYVLGVGGYDLERVEAEVDRALAPPPAPDAHSHAHDHDHDHECSGADCTDESHSHSHTQDHKHEHDHDCSGADCTDESHNHSHDHSHDHEKPRASTQVTVSAHDDKVMSVSLVVDGEMDLDKVNYWLGGIVELRGEDLYRMKGVLAIHDFDARFVFQGVHMIFDGSPDRKWAPGEHRSSKMVFIGKDLDAELFREGFEQCLKGAKEEEEEGAAVAVGASEE